MKPTDDRADLVRAGEPARVSHRIDDAGVTASAQHHQPPIAEAEHQRLVVEDQRIGLPAILRERLMPGKPSLERRLAVNLTGAEHRSVEQKRRLALLHDREPISSSAPRLETGNSAVSLGKLIRRRPQNSGWIMTGSRIDPRTRTSPSIPVT